MNRLEETLWADYDRVSEQIKCLGIGDENYETLLNEKDRILNDLIKLEQGNKEIKIKEYKIKSENKKEKVRNYITIGTFIVSTGVGVCAIINTFRFDRESTLTSTLGGKILYSAIPKMFK